MGPSLPANHEQPIWPGLDHFLVPLTPPTTQKLLRILQNLTSKLGQVVPVGPKLGPSCPKLTPCCPQVGQSSPQLATKLPRKRPVDLPNHARILYGAANLVHAVAPRAKDSELGSYLYVCMCIYTYVYIHIHMYICVQHGLYKRRAMRSRAQLTAAERSKAERS